MRVQMASKPAVGSGVTMVLIALQVYSYPSGLVLVIRREDGSLGPEQEHVDSVGAERRLFHSRLLKSSPKRRQVQWHNTTSSAPATSPLTGGLSPKDPELELST